MKVHTMLQYSIEYWEVRAGKATASEADKILTPLGKVSASRVKYAAKLAGERVFGAHPNFFCSKPLSHAMQEGIDREPESRRWYELDRSVTARQVGFCESDCGRYGCSPDGLVGEDGVVELKNPYPETHVGYLLDPAAFEQEYRPQCHFHLLVTGRPWVDLVSYCPPMPAVIVRVGPGEYTAKLAAELEKFLALTAEAERRLRGQPEPEGVS